MICHWDLRVFLFEKKMTKQKCRICLVEGRMISIFSEKETPMIYTKIMNLAKVHIYPGDGLPSTICSKCVMKLNNCIEFIKLCEASDQKLRATGKVDFKESLREETTLVTENLQNESNILKSTLQIELSKDFPLTEDVNNPLKKENWDLDCESKCVKSIHEKKIEKQQCFTCGKVMSSRFRLKTHLRTHTGERPYSCPHCNKNFSLAQNLKVHLRTHTGEKPLQCTVCGESFAQSAGLAAHKRKHTGQTPYRCVLCPRSFRTIGHLQYHIRRHTGEKNFECNTCGRAFITRSDLKQHMLSHSGDRPHVCSVCGLRLTRSSHLKRHIQHMHNGLKPFNCTCSMTFKNKCDFEKHKKHCIPQEIDEKNL